MRKIVFDLVRCMGSECFNMLVLGRHSDQIIKTYTTRTILTVLFTVFVHFAIPKSQINRNYKFYSALYVVYAATFGTWWVFELGQAEKWSKGHMDAFLFYSLFQAFSYTIGDLIEDFIYRDLGVLNWQAH